MKFGLLLSRYSLQFTSLVDMTFCLKPKKRRATHFVKKTKRKSCRGRIVFSLEGGYQLEGLKESIKAVLMELRGESVLGEPGTNREDVRSSSVDSVIDKVLDIIDEEFELIREKVWRYKNLIAKHLKDSGFNIAEGDAPITSIITGTAENTILVAKRLFENNILSTPFIPPSVPINEGKVRLIAGANLREESIEQALDIFKKL